MNEEILGKEKIGKLFIKYSIPAVIAMVLAGSQTMIDGMFLGNFVGANALASMNIVNPFLQIAMAVSIVIGLGALSIIGRTLGSGDKELSRDTFKTAFVLIVTFSVLYASAGIIFNKPISYALGANEVLVDGVANYIQHYSWFIVFMPLMVLFGFVDRTIGKPERYMLASIMSLIANIILDYIFIRELGWGLRGAAIATGTAYTVGMVVTLQPLLNPKNTLSLLVGQFKVSVIAPMLYNGSSEGISSLATALSIFLFNRAMIAQAGEAGVAAFTAVGYIVNLGSLMIFGIADGISPIISYNYGHKRPDRVHSVITLGIKVAMVIGVVVFALLMFASEGLVSLFTNGDAAVISIASNGGKIYAFAFLVNSVNIIYSIYFTAIGKPLSSGIIAVSRGIVFILIGITLFPRILGVSGIWLTVPFAETITLLVVYLVVKMNRKVNDFVHA